MKRTTTQEEASEVVSEEDLGEAEALDKTILLMLKETTKISGSRKEAQDLTT